MSDPPPALVGIGAAAGGFDAIEALIASLPARPPLAFVIVQRLSPEFLQLMREVLAGQTEMSLLTIEAGMTPKAATVYLMPSHLEVEFKEGRLEVVEPDRAVAQSRPVDRFFRSLAADRGDQAIALILSGGGRDGVAGAKSVIDAGGRLIIQQPSTAKFPSMPKAVHTACVEAEVMPVSAMADALVGTGIPSDTNVHYAPGMFEGIPESLVATLDNVAGIDLGHFSQSFAIGAIRSCMSQLGLNSVDAFAARTASDHGVLARLKTALRYPRQDFFADPPAIDALSQQILPRIIDDIHSGNDVRIWVPYCGCGEEAYMIAALIADQIGEASLPPTIRIVANGNDQADLKHASRGRYHKSVLTRIPPTIAKHCFEQFDDFIQVSATLRRMVVFSEADLLHDTPSERFDLVICREVLNCLASDVRDILIGRLIDATRINGHLVIGRADRTGFRSAMFDSVDRQGRIFRRKRSPTGKVDREQATFAGPSASFQDGAQPTIRNAIIGLAYQHLIGRYAPPSFVIDRNGQILHQIGDTEPLLECKTGGEATRLADALIAPFGTLLQPTVDRAVTLGHGVSVVASGLALYDGSTVSKIRVEPLDDAGKIGTIILVVFELEAQVDPLDELTGLPTKPWGLAP